MRTYTVTTQAELDTALESAKPTDEIICTGSGYFDVSATVTASDSATVTASDSATVTASGSATVRAWGSATVTAWGSATVTAWGSATVTASDSATVTARDSATVTAWGSATVTASDSATVTASGSATVRAWDSATVRASGSATVTASKFVAVHLFGKTVKVSGGVQIVVPDLLTPADFCDYHGVEATDGIVTLYKGVDDDYSTSNARSRKIAYLPGTQPEAADFEPTAVCGHGLHFCARPAHTLRYNMGASRFVACPVALADLVVVDPGPNADKAKAPRVVGPIVEVDIDGKPVAAKPKRTRKAAAK